MNRQTIVGIFTIIALAGLFGIFLVLANVGTQGRYKVGVHFKSAAGLHRGALVYESGVIVGTVDKTILLPEDFTVEVVLAINNSVDIPRDAKFVVAAPLTGDVSIEIVPPRGANTVTGATAILPHALLPLDQQPQGTNPPTITDLLEQGQGQVKRLDRMLAELERREPELLDTLQSSLRNANELTSNGNRQMTQITQKLSAMMDTLSVAMDSSGKNIVSLTGRLDSEVARNSGQVDSIVALLNRTARSLNATVDSMRDLANNREVRQNLIDTTRGLAQTATTIGAITEDLHRVTGNDQTQAQMRDTVANVNAATQKLNSLLGSLGGRSSVYGVDRGATPAPVATVRPPGAPGAPGAPVPLPPRSGPVPSASGSPSAVADTKETVSPDVRARLGSITRNLLAIQIRVSQLDKPKPGSFGSPILTTDRGPQTDFNVVALPRGRTSLLTGANDIGAAGTTTWNLALRQAMGNNIQIGGGVLSSRLGVLGRYEPGPFSVEARFYDVRRPTFDAYAGFKLVPGVELFGGERDALRSGRRTVFGLQLQF
jgi:ABC-type transporter Mla subunit MlaD